ncbi:MAG: hypothetical protein ACR2LT_03950 [Pyrinomonadaceae bacterium]
MALHKRPNSKYWQMKFTFDGQLIQQSTKVTNKRDAATIEAAFRHELALGRIGIKPKKDAPTFAAAASDFLKWSKVSHAERTTERREWFAVQVLTDFFGKKKTDAIEAKDVEKFVVWRAVKRRERRERKSHAARSTVN